MHSSAGGQSLRVGILIYITTELQKLPRGAFLDLAALRRMTGGARGSLRVLCLSYPWLQPDDPDPKGTTLRLLGRVLEKFVADDKYGTVAGTYAVFIDFCCLHQVDPATGKRTDSEQALFSRALAKCVAPPLPRPLHAPPSFPHRASLLPVAQPRPALLAPQDVDP